MSGSRKRDVLEIFTEVDGGEQLDPGITLGVFLPPWRDGAAEYGPTVRGYQRQFDRYLEGRAGGGLWDHETEASMHPMPTPERDDEQALGEYVFDAHSDVTPRLRQVYDLYYVRGLSRRKVAQELGVAESTVRVLLRKLRRRAR